jgi:hypothetical protein
VNQIVSTVLRYSAGAALGLGLAWQLLAAPVLAQAAPQRPAAEQAVKPAREPALWVVRDEDSTIYLFGTVHLLKDETAWRTPKIEAAFKESSELWLELAETGDEAASNAAMQRLIPEFGLDLARPLSTKLNATDQKRVAAAAARLGVPAAQLEPLRPWLAALTFAVVPLQQSGYDPKLGVDPLLAAAARAQNKPIKAFESIEQQIRFFADLPPEVELQMLRKTLDEVEKNPATLDALSSAWAMGDEVRFERLFVDELKKESPEFYKVILADRNTAWAEAIAERLKGSGVSFVAVGAGHLVGPDSVQNRLQALGVKAERR